MRKTAALSSMVLAIAIVTAVPARTVAADRQAAPTIDACALLSREEAAQIVGVAIDRLESKPSAGESTCNYFATPTSKPARQKDVAKRFLDIARGGREPEAEPRGADATELTRQTGLGDLVKAVGAAAGDSNAPYLAVTVHWDGARAGFAALKGTIAVQSAGVKTTETLRGIGDDAFLGPMDTFLMFVKGGTSVTIGLSQVPTARDKGIEMAKKIASRL